MMQSKVAEHEVKLLALREAEQAVINDIEAGKFPEFVHAQGFEDHLSALASKARKVNSGMTMGVLPRDIF